MGGNYEGDFRNLTGSVEVFLEKKREKREKLNSSLENKFWGFWGV
jgi:hypothetical protein